jgi:adenosylcobinamide-GDP ribazoletransferase
MATQGPEFDGPEFDGPGSGGGPAAGAGASASASASASTGASGSAGPGVDTAGTAAQGPHSVADGLRLAISTLTVVRTGPGRTDRRTVATAMTLAPLVGAGLGAVAAVVGWALWQWTGSTLIAGVAAVAALAALTRGLHLDGLADTADGLGLGAHRSAAEALAAMRRSDIGPFGVVTLVLVLAAQTACVSAAFGHGRGPAAVLVAAVAGRTALTTACTPAIPAARPDGLGAWVAGSVQRGTAWTTALVATAACGLLGAAVGPRTATLALIAVPVALGASWLLLGHCVRRFGGLTGDVLGAVVETGTAAALVVLAASGR